MFCYHGNILFVPTCSWAYRVAICSYLTQHCLGLLLTMMFTLIAIPNFRYYAPNPTLVDLGSLCYCGIDMTGQQWKDKTRFSFLVLVKCHIFGIQNMIAPIILWSWCGNHWQTNRREITDKLTGVDSNLGWGNGILCSVVAVVRP